MEAVVIKQPLHLPLILKAIFRPRHVRLATAFVLTDPFNSTQGWQQTRNRQENVSLDFQESSVHGLWRPRGNKLMHRGGYRPGRRGSKPWSGEVFFGMEFAIALVSSENRYIIMVNVSVEYSHADSDVCVECQPARKGLPYRGMSAARWSASDDNGKDTVSE